MWPSGWPSGTGRDLVPPYPAAYSLPQNFRVYNPAGNPDMQNQQETIYSAPATYPPCVPYAQEALPAPYSQQALPAPYLQQALPAPYSQQALPAPYLQQALPAPYSQQALPAPYSQQAFPAPYAQRVSGVGWPQDPIAGDIVLRDPNWPIQSRNRRESMPAYNNGEMVMVRCNQQKWLSGVIQRMSIQGLRVWLGDAHILVNVPLVLVPTHVVKMSTFSDLQTLPQPQGEHMWTMTITDNSGCRKALMQCVRPAHLSHRRLFQKFGCIECALCKTTVSSIEVVSPWNCGHQVHNYCLQLRMQHTSTVVCPLCDEINTRQLVSIPSTVNGSTLQRMPSTSMSTGSTSQLMPSTSTGIGSTSQLMPSPFASNALPSPRNGQYQPWLDVQCACGFRGSTAGVGNMNAPVFCPNCYRPASINSTTLGMQRGEPFATMNLPRAYTEVERETLQRKSLQDQGFGWDMQPFSVPNRLEAIQEGSLEGISSTPPSPDYSSLELLGTDEERKEFPYLPSYLLSFGETFENNIPDPDFVAGVADRNMQPFSSSRSSWPGGLLYEPSGQSSARSSLQGGAFTAFSPPRTSLTQNGQTSARSSLQDAALSAPSQPRISLIQNGQSSTRSSLEDAALTAPFPTNISLTQNGQSSARSLYSPPVQVTRIQKEESRDRAPGPMKFLIDPAASTQVSHIPLTEVEEADEPSEKRDTEPTTIAAPDRKRLWRRVSEVDWMRRTFDKDSEEASSSNDFAVRPPSSPPVYVNHFANFVNLAMAGASTAKERAKEILASASVSPSSSTSDPLLKSPTPAWVTPAPAIITPPPAFFTRAPELNTEAPAIVTPARAFFSRAPALITEPPVWVTMASGGDASSAWITVIKDGVDSRKEDSKQWELNRLAQKKEDEFL